MTVLQDWRSGLYLPLAVWRWNATCGVGTLRRWIFERLYLCAAGPGLYFVHLLVNHQHINCVEALRLSLVPVLPMHPSGLLLRHRAERVMGLDRTAHVWNVVSLAFRVHFSSNEILMHHVHTPGCVFVRRPSGCLRLQLWGMLSVSLVCPKACFAMEGQDKGTRSATVTLALLLLKHHKLCAFWLFQPFL